MEQAAVSVDVVDHSEKVTWGPVAAVILTVIFFFVSQVIGVLLLSIGAMLFDGQTTDSLVAENGPLDTTIYIFAGNALVTASLFVLIRGYLEHKKSSFKALGLHGFNWKHLFSYGLGGVLIYFVCAIAVSVIVGAFWPDLLKQEQNIGFNRMASGLELLPIFASLVILPPLIEEVLCRGFLFGGLRTRLTFFWSTLITSLIFALPHLQGGNSTPLVWAAGIDTFMLSVVMCWMRERSGSLWVPILIHAIKNGVAFAGIFLFS